MSCDEDKTEGTHSLMPCKSSVIVCHARLGLPSAKSSKPFLIMLNDSISFAPNVAFPPELALLSLSIRGPTTPATSDLPSWASVLMSAEASSGVVSAVEGGARPEKRDEEEPCERWEEEEGDVSRARCWR